MLVRALALGLSLSFVACSSDDGGDKKTTPPGPCATVGAACTGDTQPQGFGCLAGKCVELCSTSDQCDDGQFCDTDAAIDHCAASACTNFFDHDCGADSRCVPAGNGANRCAVDGNGAQSSQCDEHEDCDANLICAVGYCIPPNCTTAAGIEPCTVAGETCQTLPDTDLGLCAQVCDLFGSDCTGGEACLVGADATRVGGDIQGICAPPLGSIAEGASCGSAGGCAGGLYCVGATSTTGVCRRLCDPQATASAPGDTCDAGDNCQVLSLRDGSGTTVAVPFGVCTDGCDYDTGSPACPGGMTCFAKEYTGGQNDSCGTMASALAEFATCSPTTHPENSFCGDGMACFDLGELSASGFSAGVKCYDLCRGSYGTTNHPDCSRTSATCVQVSTGFGACAP